jgi:AAA domain
MRIRRLAVKEFGGIREADIELGPGLNVLYGPNDLGKSTLADAIRLALLLPHTSSHVDEYVPWSGGQSPVIELTFETGPQRIWRVRKEFRKGGASLLEESKNGVDFDEVERARKVDGRLRDLLAWGIPEPGGSGGSKGFPSSFLATVLLSTQSEVSAILSSPPRSRRWRRIPSSSPCCGTPRRAATRPSPRRARGRPPRAACSRMPPTG